MNDTLTISGKSRKSEKIKAVLDTTDAKPVVGWLSLDKDAFQASVIRTPAREDVDLEIEEHLIVELYSK
jgi:small subunit ribosomal protein S4